MSSSFLTVLAISLHLLPVLSHRLISDPYPSQQFDSVIVSSDPITIRDRTQNDTQQPINPNRLLKPQKRSYDECPQNDFACLYSNSDSTNDSARVIQKFLDHYSTLPDRTKNLTDPSHNQNSRNSYWTMLHSQTHNHPFDDKTGWVTLDPVPWSTSKISKWHPNKLAIHQENKPWDYGPTTQKPVHQFWVSGSSYQPQRPATHWGIGTNDIITDNNPSGFPTGQFHGYGSPDRGPNQAESGMHEYSGQQHQFDQNYNTKGTYPSRLPQTNHPSRLPQTNHPSTYPSNGNGEWVLLSTTKGYSLPQRHRWPAQKDLKLTERLFASRRIKTPDISRYHEEDLREKLLKNSPNNRKSDVSSPDATNTTQPSTDPPLQVLYTSSSKDGETSATFRRKVRLQVLPSLETSSTSHGGLLEVDSSQQTVDEAQQQEEEEKMEKLKAIANVKKNKIRGYRLVPTSKIIGKAMKDKNVMTLAAVGAGMIPATMALLVPMALGRRKRSLLAEEEKL